jgi:hypothetical protein
LPGFDDGAFHLLQAQGLGGDGDAVGGNVVDRIVRASAQKEQAKGEKGKLFHDGLMSVERAKGPAHQ